MHQMRRVQHQRNIHNKHASHPLFTTIPSNSYVKVRHLRQNKTQSIKLCTCENCFRIAQKSLKRPLRKFCHYLIQAHNRLSDEQENISHSKRCESYFNRYDYHIVLHHKPHINGHAQDCFSFSTLTSSWEEKQRHNLKEKHTDNVFQLPKVGPGTCASFMVSKYESCRCLKPFHCS